MSQDQDNVAYWNGPAGERWATQQERLDRAVAPFGSEAIARAQLEKGERVLDVGCGCGATLLEAAARVGERGRVLGVDISRPMLARAAERTRHLPQVETRLADAGETILEPALDVLISRFGVMFFADPVKAFTNLARSLGPKGRLSFACWRPLAENPWMRVPFEAVVRFFPEAGEIFVADEPGPFAFADPEKVTRVLGAAGFTDIATAPFDAEVTLSETSLEDAADFGVVAGPGARLLGTADESLRIKVRAAVREALAPHADGKGVRLEGLTWMVSARKA